MDEQRGQFIRELITRGKSYEEIKFELISQGFGTAQLDTEYAALCAELKVTPSNRPTSQALDPLRVSSFTPDPITGEIPLPGGFAMLRYATQLVTERFSIVVAAAVVIIIASISAFFVPNQPNPYLYGVPFVVANVLAYAVVGIVMVMSFTALVYTFVFAEDRASFLQGWQWALSRLWSLLWLGLLSLCILLGSFAALVLPALIFVIFNCFSVFVLAKYNQGGMSAISRSTDLVMGKFWPILVRLLMLAFIALPPLIIGTILSQLSESLYASLPLASLAIDAVIIAIATLTFSLVVGALLSLFHARTQIKSFYDASQYRVLRASYWLLFLLGLLIPVAGFLFGMFAFTSFYEQYQEQILLQFDSGYSQFPSALEDGGEQVDTFIVERRVDTMFSAGMVHYGRMKSFEGVCSDVLIEAPARCLSTNKTFVIDAPLGNGSYYCRDSGGFKGRVAAPARSASGCQ